MYGEQGFKAIQKTVHLVKFIGKGCSICFLSAYITLLSTKDIKYCKVPMYLAAQQQNKLIQFPVCASVGVLFSLEILPQGSESTCKPDFLFNNFGFGVLNSQKCYVMFWCIECYLTKTEVGIRFQ